LHKPRSGGEQAKTTSPQIDKIGNNDNNTKQKGPNLDKKKKKK
jgi:hypothetical protein